jgi:hypothetical protein
MTGEVSLEESSTSRSLGKGVHGKEELLPDERWRAVFLLLLYLTGRNLGHTPV